MNSVEHIISEDTYHQYLSRLLSGNRFRCSDIVEEQLRRHLPVKDLYTSVPQVAVPGW